MRVTESTIVWYHATPMSPHIPRPLTVEELQAIRELNQLEDFLFSAGRIERPVAADYRFNENGRSVRQCAQIKRQLREAIQSSGIGAFLRGILDE